MHKDLTMIPTRGPFQGVWNIVRFNWHFYVLSLGGAIVLLTAAYMLYGPLQLCAAVGGAMLLTISGLSLLVSWYVYDLSKLYDLDWCGTCEPGSEIVNIHAGFDESSALLQAKYPGCGLIVFDFYDPAKHTEVSIRRARRACAAFPGTLSIDTAHIPLPDDSADAIFLILSAHEIRRDDERIGLFKEIWRIIKPSGRIVAAEHLRDVPNFIAYTVGFFHFLPRETWLKTFRAAGLQVAGESKVNPFITTFILTKHGTAP
jgi:SAM-dependent methyltransferase